MRSVRVLEAAAVESAEAAGQFDGNFAGASRKRLYFKGPQTV
jgi:hypothetical protein